MENVLIEGESQQRAYLPLDSVGDKSLQTVIVYNIVVKRFNIHC
jgi:hypothetical protein